MNNRYLLLGLAALLFFCLVGAFVRTPPTQANTTFTVDRLDDAVIATACTAALNDCSLRGAIIAANNAAGADTIILPSGVYTLMVSGAGENAAATGDLDITGNLTLSGDGAAITIVDGNQLDRVLDVIGASTSVTITGVTIANGNSTAAGGGILNAGHLVLVDSVILSNTTAAEGGGLAQFTGATVIVTNTTVVGNVAAGTGGGVYLNGGLTLANSAVISNTSNADGTNEGGGGLHVDVSGILSVTNSTVSGNAARDNGGGIYLVGGVVTLTNVTIANNTADFMNSTGGNQGGGVYNTGGSITARNTLIATNIDASSSTNHPDCSGTLTSADYNLIGNTTGCILAGTTTGNITGMPSGFSLGPLQHNGGSTLTHALPFGNPAIGAGNPDVPGSGGNACPITDQRGLTRPQGERCDIGAYEYEPKAGAATVSPATDPTPNGCFPNDCSLREAIIAANAAPGADIVTLLPGLHEIRITALGEEDRAWEGDLDITDDLTIKGSSTGTTTIDNDITERVFQITGTIAVTITNVIIQDGFDDNGVGGGGIWNNGGTVVISNTAFLTNTARLGDGGAVYNSVGTLTLTNSTISGNRAASNGGGLSVTSGTVNLNHVTFKNNTADGFTDNLAGNGGGVFVAVGATLNLTNTLVGDNSDNSSSPKHPDCSGEIISHGYNLIEDTTGCTVSGTNHNVTGRDPNLGPLADNGGSTLTHALLQSSPAVDWIPSNYCLPADQRGALRPQPQGGKCDIGAFELILVQFTSADYSEIESVGMVTIPVALTNQAPFTITVDYTTSDGTAKALSDYIEVNGTLVFTPGVTSRMVPVQIVSDAIYELAETFTVRLSNAVNATITGTNPITVEILDDDPPPQVMFSSSTYTVSEAVGSALVTVILTGTTEVTATVNIATSDGTSKAPSDYTVVSRTLVFTPEVTSQMVPVQIVSDTVYELAETFTVALSNAISATISRTNPITVTIVDDDPPPQLRLYLPIVFKHYLPGCEEYEVEPNDDLPQAYGPLASGKMYCGQQPDNDLNDWYRIQVPVDGTIAVELGRHYGGGVQVLIYQEDRSRLCKMNWETPDPSIHRLNCSVEAGSKYIRIYRVYLTPGSEYEVYQLKVTYPATPQIQIDRKTPP
jgi:CSLREA domain-containing protein